MIQSFVYIFGLIVALGFTLFGIDSIIWDIIYVISTGWGHIIREKCHYRRTPYDCGCSIAT